MNARAAREPGLHAAEVGRHAATWRLDLAYEGTAYHGWAAQPGQVTVEGVLRETLTTVLGEPVRLSVAGRTDAGVHAWAQVASFECRRDDVRPERLRHSLNALLPPDIGVHRVTRAPDGFRARDAGSRSYRYALWVSPVKPVRERGFVWNLRGGVDGALLRETAALLPGRRDFAALTPSAHLYHSCVREVLAAAWSDDGPTPDGDGRLWTFTVTAGSFLHNMVRVAVGSMVDVAQDRLTVAAFAEGLAAGERRLLGQTAPARGLALVGVEYGAEAGVSSRGSA